MIKMAMAKKTTGRIEAIVLPSLASPWASEKDATSSLVKIRLVFSSALLAAFLNSSLPSLDKTWISE